MRDWILDSEDSNTIHTDRHTDTDRLLPSFPLTHTWSEADGQWH